MDKRICKNVIILLSIIFVIGIIMILKAPDYGTMMTEMARNGNGGSLNFDESCLLMEAHTLGFQIVGAIVSSLAGLAGLLVSYLQKIK